MTLYQGGLVTTPVVPATWSRRGFIAAAGSLVGGLALGAAACAPAAVPAPVTASALAAFKGFGVDVLAGTLGSFAGSTLSARLPEAIGWATQQLRTAGFDDIRNRKNETHYRARGVDGGAAFIALRSGTAECCCAFISLAGNGDVNVVMVESPVLAALSTVARQSLSFPPDTTSAERSQRLADLLLPSGASTGNTGGFRDGGGDIHWPTRSGSLASRFESKDDHGYVTLALDQSGSNGWTLGWRFVSQLDSNNPYQLSTVDFQRIR